MGCCLGGGGKDGEEEEGEEEGEKHGGCFWLGLGVEVWCRQEKRENDGMTGREEAGTATCFLVMHGRNTCWEALRLGTSQSVVIAFCAEQPACFRASRMFDFVRQRYITLRALTL